MSESQQNKNPWSWVVPTLLALVLTVASAGGGVIFSHVTHPEYHETLKTRVDFEAEARKSSIRFLETNMNLRFDNVDEKLKRIEALVEEKADKDK